MTHTDLAKMPVSEKTQLMESLWESVSSSEASAAAIPKAFGVRLDIKSYAEPCPACDPASIIW